VPLGGLVAAKSSRESCSKNALRYKTPIQSYDAEPRLVDDKMKLLQRRDDEVLLA
jgi:hypothetical protein